MPSVSKKQHNLMAAVAHSPDFAKKVGIKQSVGKEFMSADKGKKFAKGGTMAKMKHDDLAEDKKLIKKAFSMHDKQEHKGSKTDLSKLKKGGCATKMCGGGKVKKMADGGKTGGKAKKLDIDIAMLKAPQRPARPAPVAPQAAAPARAPGMMARPGMPMNAPAGVPPMMKKGGCVKKASGGLAAGHKTADGIAKKGKTKGAEVKMARGGSAKKKYC